MVKPPSRPEQPAGRRKSPQAPNWGPSIDPSCDDEPPERAEEGGRIFIFMAGAL